MFHRQKSEDETTQPQTTEGNSMSAPQQNNEENKTEQSNNSNSSSDRSISIPGSGLSRLGQQPRMPGAYPTYGTNSSFTPAGTSTMQGENGRKLLVGPGISLSGEIEACDHLVVDGKVEAALKGAKLLEINESGTFFGTVEIDEATVAGTFEGDLTVTGRLTIKTTGSITGAISYGELAVEAGATLDGKLSPLSSKAVQTKKPTKAAAKKEQAAVQTYQQQVDNVAPEQQGGELPFADNRVAAAE